jgi:hypothetical protein
MSGIVKTVVIRDKSVAGNRRIVNAEDVTKNDVIMPDPSEPTDQKAVPAADELPS